MNVDIEKTWRKELVGEFNTPYFTELTSTVREKYLAGAPIYPAPKNVFNAFELCPFNAVKVVILGQDPYHGEGQAHGLCFSVQDGVKVPPSLQNIYKELQSDLGIPIRTTGDLSLWAKQGVLLLNATLTVEAGKAGSHQGLGWEQFTDAVIRNLSEKKEHLVFLLWGKYAQDKGAIIDTTKHLVLKAPHPSPFSAYTGFFGCKHFSKANEYLQRHAKSTIQW
ncbi:MAG: uracil-DNA glycosylase [Candidatus Kaiserbacteria bacterium]|nr:uracil-DNA glycosylase [Candidatus Kaiserbacteria bacterium]